MSSFCKLETSDESKKKINNPENENEKGKEKGKEKYVLHGAPKKASSLEKSSANPILLT